MRKFPAQHFGNLTIGYHDSEYNETIAKDSLQEFFQISSLMYIVPEMAIMLFVSFGNVLVLLAVRRFRELQTTTNIFVVNLAIADLSVGIFVLPLHIIIFILPFVKSEFFVCMLRYGGMIASCGVSGLTLVTISIDRYIAIEKPYSYTTIMTHTTSKIVCAGIWMFSLIYAALPSLGWNRWSSCTECTFTIVLPGPYLTFIMAVILGCVFIIGILNFKIFITANAISREIHKQEASVGGQGNDQKYKQLFLKNKKAAKALVMVFGIFGVCVLPFATFTLWEIYCLNEDSRIRYSVVRIATTILGTANSGMNPVIYHRRMPKFNAAFRSLLGIKRKVTPAGTAHGLTGCSTYQTELPRVN